MAQPLARTPKPPRPTYEDTVSAYDNIMLSEGIVARGSFNRPQVEGPPPSKRPRMSFSEFIAQVNPLPPCAPEEGQVRKKPGSRLQWVKVPEAKFHGQVVKARFQTPEEESRWWFPDPEESQVASPASPMQEETQGDKSSEEESCWGPSSSTTPARTKPYEL